MDFERKTQIVARNSAPTRSASSIYELNHGATHGELYYTGNVPQAWGSFDQDQKQWYQFTFKDIVSVSEIRTRGRGDSP
jgi:hypothetical protein